MTPVHTTNASMDEVLRDAVYYASLRHPCGWPAIDEISGGVAPAGVWTLASPDAHLRRVATMHIAASLAGCTDRTAIISTVAAAADVILEVVAPPCRVHPTVLPVSPERIRATSRWVLDDRWELLNLDTYGPDDNLNDALAPRPDMVRTLIIDRADLLTPQQLADLLGDQNRPEPGETATAALTRFARRSRTRLVLSSATLDGAPNERDDVSLTIRQTTDQDNYFDCIIELRGHHGLHATFDVTTVGLEWQLRTRTTAGIPHQLKPATDSALDRAATYQLHRPQIGHA